MWVGGVWMAEGKGLIEVSVTKHFLIYPIGKPLPPIPPPQWANMPIDQQRHHYNMTVFGSLSAAVSIVALIRSLYFFSSTLRASTRMHARSLTGVLRSPLSFFHTNPAGRVLNRFSKDLGIVDDLLPMVMFDWRVC